MSQSRRWNVSGRSPLVLASESPRRRALLIERGYEFSVVPPPLEEPDALNPDLSPAQLAEALAYFKAKSVAAKLSDGWVLGGDTVVALDRQVFGKPVDRDNARAILSALAGTTHEVLTGVALVEVATGRRTVRHDSTAVTMRALGEEELEDYLETNAWQGKAGAYGIQDYGDAFVTGIDGSFTNVVGFPMELIMKMLSDCGIEPAAI